MAEEKTASAKLVDSVALTLTARVAMIVATSFILPLALMMGQRAISSIDKLSEKIDTMREQAIETSGEVRALTVQLTEQQRTLADHEARVRVLEAAGRVAQPITRP
jgi:hypothetical protein